VFPDQSADPGQDCSIVGVLGPVTGVIGSMQATETIKVVIGSSSINAGALILYDAESQSIDRLALHKVVACATCGENRVPGLRV
jgi:adenylyltransferase/sulfurtransferase